MKFSTDDRDDKNGKNAVGPWVEKYKRQIAAGGVLLCLVAVMAATLLGKDKRDVQAEAADAEVVAAAAAEPATSEKTEKTEKSGEEEDAGISGLEPVEVPNNLEENANPQVTELIQTYYTCMAAGDVEGLLAVVDVLTEEEQSYVESLKTLIEGYQNVRCYTKRGMDPGTYLAFARYDLKFVAADTMAPGIEAYYVGRNDDGSYYILLDTPSQELLDYVNQVVQDEDVQALYQEVQTAFESAKSADEKLAEYGMKLEELKGGSEPESGEEQPAEGEEQPAEGEGEQPAEGEGEQPAEGQETPEEAPAEEPEQQPEETPAPSGDGTEVNKETRFKESTNVRKDRSTDSERLALGYQGEHVTQVMDYSDGWSKIIYNGQEGYCKTEYLE
ncbi:MAG: hypothetical protein HFI30_01240 [Lachnospiraceae bacterium]|jgi:hypothetical protein|nr:hypothetical protein [Lachnospiraceae bacterium]